MTKRTSDEIARLAAWVFVNPQSDYACTELEDYSVNTVGEDEYLVELFLKQKYSSESEYSVDGTVDARVEKFERSDEKEWKVSTDRSQQVRLDPDNPSASPEYKQWVKDGIKPVQGERNE